MWDCLPISYALSICKWLDKLLQCRSNDSNVGVFTDDFVMTVKLHFLLVYLLPKKQDWEVHELVQCEVIQDDGCKQYLAVMKLSNFITNYQEHNHRTQSSDCVLWIGQSRPVIWYGSSHTYLSLNTFCWLKVAWFIIIDNGEPCMCSLLKSYQKRFVIERKCRKSVQKEGMNWRGKSRYLPWICDVSRAKWFESNGRQKIIFYLFFPCLPKWKGRERIRCVPSCERVVRYLTAPAPVRYSRIYIEFHNHLRLGNIKQGYFKSTTAFRIIANQTASTSLLQYILRSSALFFDVLFKF